MICGLPWWASHNHKLPTSGVHLFEEESHMYSVCATVTLTSTAGAQVSPLGKARTLPLEHWVTLERIYVLLKDRSRMPSSRGRCGSRLYDSEIQCFCLVDI